MLNQLIYTRCSPHRDLKKQGQVARGDGFGVFSVSPELFSESGLSSYDFLQARLALQNGAKETSAAGLFHSYEYSELENHTYALSYEFARPHCKTPRKNGQGHRTGTYIKQCFVGKFSSYPFAWFGAGAWDAYKKSENDYYLDEDPHAEPELLAQVSDTPQGGYISPELVKKFVQEGREEAVKSGLWFLLHEYEKPEGERKVLLIKDTPEHVELWIAAMEYGLSAEMAAGITFTTNRSKLGQQADNVLFYYTDENGKFYPMMNRSVKQERHPYCMLVGYHPSDQFCSSIKQMPTSNFVLLDGVNKTIGLQTDASIQSPYYAAVLQYGADIQDFCNVVLPSLPMKGISTQLPALFDAYKYLLDSNHKADQWRYADALQAIQLLTQAGLPSNLALNEYLLNECLHVYPRFVEEDEARGYVLLKIMQEFARPVQREREITGCIADRVVSELNRLDTKGEKLAGTWRALKQSNISGIAVPALRALFEEEELEVYQSQFSHASGNTIETVLDMYLSTMEQEPKGLQSIDYNGKGYPFICYAIDALFEKQEVVYGIMQRLQKGDPVAFSRIAALMGRHFAEIHSPKEEAWWELVLDASGKNVTELCRVWCSYKLGSISMVEVLLASQIRKTHRCDKSILKAFSNSIEACGKAADTGVKLFGAWIQAGGPEEALSIIKAVQSFSLGKKAQTELFHMLDEELQYNTKAKAEDYKSLRMWAEALGKPSRSVSFFEVKHVLEHEKHPEKAVQQLYVFAAEKFEVDAAYINSDYCSELAEAASEYCDAEVHVAALCMYDIQDKRLMERYVDQYVYGILSNTKGKKLVSQLLAICEATLIKVKVPGRTVSVVKEVEMMIDQALSKHIQECYKSSLTEQIAKADCEPEVKKKLLALLKEAAQKSSSKGVLGGFFERFRKR